MIFLHMNKMMKKIKNYWKSLILLKKMKKKKLKLKLKLKNNNHKKSWKAPLVLVHLAKINRRIVGCLLIIYQKKGI